MTEKKFWKMWTSRRTGLLLFCLGLTMVLLATAYMGARAIVIDLTLVGELHESQAEHVSQAELLELVSDGHLEEAFVLAFELGDELFETQFNALDGIGANVGDGQRFTRVPRADLDGPGEWANHFPMRPTGPNADACNQCHNTPFDDGAGISSSNVIRDPLHTGNPSFFINRNTTHVFAPGALQRLAEEMTEELHAIRDAAAAEACNTGQAVTVNLVAKGVDFGVLTIPACNADPDTSGVAGVDSDLVVKPFQWKGNTASVRGFNRDAANNELGMQAVELVGEGIDGDYDGVVNEFTVGDITALTIYLAAQPRPTTLLEMAAVGMIDPLSEEEEQAILDGEVVFASIGCASCHVPELIIDDPVFSEPSQNPYYRDAVFPSGADPLAAGLDPNNPITFNLTSAQPDNILRDVFGNIIFRLGAFEADEQGRAIVRLFGDLKRHDMGPGLAERIDETGTGASVFMTENLWGVGSTGPYLHDGRATTLTEAIIEHGGEAATSRDDFLNLLLDDQMNLIAFLNNLVLLKEEDVDPPALDCSVNYQITSQWGTGFTAVVSITNYGDEPIYGWSLNWGFAGDQHITGAWNATVNQSGSRVLASNLPNHWNGTINADGGSVSFGFQAAYSGSNEIPTPFLLNGALCTE